VSDKVKIALIAAVTAIIVTGLVIYFSPYQSCVRGFGAKTAYTNPPVFCANITH